jgi:F0F1-type ATP synthase membrane subunit b/b'
VSKFLAVPSVTGLNELFDLLSHPAKYKAYVKRLQEMLVELDLRIGDLDTKEKIEKMLSDATCMRAEAEQTLLDAKNSAQRIREGAKTTANQLYEETDKAKQRVKDSQSQVDAALEVIKQREAACQELEERMAQMELNMAELRRETTQAITKADNKYKEYTVLKQKLLDAVK